MTILLDGVVLVAGTIIWSWGTAENAALFIAFALALTIVGGVRPGATGDAFVEGMQGMLIACVMIGLGSAMQVLLQSSQILDSRFRSLRS